MPSPIEKSQVSRSWDRTRTRPGKLARKSHLRRVALENLEPRTLLAVLPAPTHSAQVPNPIDISGTSGNSNKSAPKIAVDPTNPNKLVAAWVDLDPADFGPPVQSLIHGAYSTNGGATWTAYNVPGNVLDPTTSNPTIPFILADTPSIAFDRQHHFYLLSDQHNSGSGAGAFVLNVYDFSGSTPTHIATPSLGVRGNGAVSEWESNPETNPQLIVDNSVDTFTDPTTGLTQTDPFGGTTNGAGANVGNVYVDWATNYAWPFTSPVPSTYNPNRIKIVASSTGGQTFGPEKFVDSTGFFSGAPRYTAPTEAVTQGRAPTTFGPSDRGVQGGLISVGFDDFNSGATASTPFDVLLNNRFTPGVSDGFVPTFPPTVLPVLVPAGGTVAVPVNVPSPFDSRFTTLSDIQVTVNISAQNLSMFKLELQAPDGTKYQLMDSSLTGANLGIDGNGNPIGTTFDLNALATIGTTSGGAPFIGNFRPIDPPLPVPPGGDNPLSFAIGRTAAQVAGQWNLIVTDTDTNPDAVVNWTLHLTSAMNNAADTVINAQNYVRNNAPIGNSAMPQGIIPGLTFAFDNTLGSYSAHEGRLYAAFVDTRPASLGGIYSANPADNTDIYLKVSDDGGVTWTSPSTLFGLPLTVNSDDGVLDGFSEGVSLTDIANGTAAKITGRPQFEPSVAVDPLTGTLVVSYYDTRYDPARARVSTTIATSLDGGATFSPEVFANLPNQALDEITRQTVTLGPIPDNESGGNSKTDSTNGYGPSQGLAVMGGHIYPVWSSNQNGGPVDGTSTRTLNITLAPMVTAAGPRIISSTMGPVKPSTVNGTTFNNTLAADGTNQVNGFVVEFDRPVDFRTFDATSVQIQYRSPTTPVGQAGTPVAVGTVTPLDLTGPPGLLAIEATKFLVSFATPQSAVGTYSYEITPGKIHDVIRSNPVNQIVTPGVTNVYSRNNLNLPIPSVGTGGTNSPQDFQSSTATVNNIPVTAVVNHVTVTVQLNHTSDRDLVITLIAPDGTPVTLVRNRGGSGHNYNTTTFDDTAAISITAGSAPFNGTFRPEQSLDGTLKGRTAFGNWTLQIQDTQPGDVGTLLNWSLSLQIGALSYQPTQQAGNLMDQNANGVPGQSSDFYATPMPLAGGTAFNAPYDPTTLPLVIPGPHVTGTQAVLTSGALAPISGDNLVTDNTVSGLDVTFDRDMNSASFTLAQVLRILGPAGLVVPQSVVVSPANANPSHIRTFRIGFPSQQLSGTYTITLASSIKSAAGDALDTNLNAGVDVLRGVSPVGTTTPITTPSTDTPIAIPPQKTITSLITVSSSFPIQGATLTLNITDPFDPDLQATLIAQDPGGNPANDITIPLFNGVGTAGTHMNFQNTIFDDSAATPIENGGAPFFGTFKPQTPLNGVLVNTTSARTYVLQITNRSTTNTGTLNSWSITLLKGVPGTGLGEPVADQALVSFRIFTMDPTNPLSSNTWTAVGPAAIGSSGSTPGSEGQSAASRSGRIGGLAFDPSDPSGNTVYVGGASGGIWKTTDFLTTSPAGPTYIPLTDFGPNFAINTGSIAVFGRNNDTNQSIVLAATGEGDTGTQGFGVLRSMDGGATWGVLDSTTNVDSNGNLLPITSPLRDHVFAGTTSFKILVDPQPTKAGGTLAYLAVAGNGQGGIYRTVDAGNHWSKVLSGDATDIALDPTSGFVNAFSNPTGNLQFIYAALRGVGVYQSQNEGLTWALLLGGNGNPLFQDITKANFPPVPITGPTAAPASGGGRIVLAKPALVPNNAAENQLYAGWLYTAAVTAGGTLQGLYMTKDFGRNWTKLTLPNQVTTLAPNTVQADPSNDTRLTNIDPLGSANFAQGNYDVSLIADPNNPNVVYLGGTADGNATGIIRIDTTGVSDPYAFYMGENTTDNAVRPNTTDPVGLNMPNVGPVATTQFPFVFTEIDPRTTPTINMVHDPFHPFSNSTFYATNITSFANSGANVRWIPFDAAVQGSTDQHRVIAMRDPLTGLSRLIFGDDQGVFSDLVAADGTLVSGLGVNNDNGNSDVLVPTGSRNGNLQITQFYYGAAQASNIAAQIATLQGMFYGNAQDDGFPQSDPNVVQTGAAGYGNLVWIGPGGDGGGVAVDQNDHRGTGQTTGDVFQYKWPCCGGNVTDFFQVNGVGQTSGLVRNIQPGSVVPDPQWPYLAVLNFAVNPLDADQIVISSAEGRVYRTENRGQNWTEIAEPGSDILDSAQSIAMAYGAPQPTPPGGTATLDNFIYVGTTGGHVYVTFQGGGPGAWTDISAGLDGSPVEQIVTNPTRGSQEAYAVTTTGVFHMVDSSAAGAQWTNITNNLLALTHNPFGNAALNEKSVTFLDALQADWRYVIPDSLNNPGGSTHPLLYVGGQAGVYRSLDGGQTWAPFPDSGAGSLLNSPYAVGGGIPDVNITSLNLSLGFINPTTGQPDESTGSNVLLASTYGRGSFAIRLAPIVLPNSLALDPNQPAPGGSDSGISKTDKITNVKNPFIDGLSEASAFGNTVVVNLIDETPGDPTFGQVIGTGQTDATSHLAHSIGNGLLAPGIQITASLPDGMKTIGVQATNASGTKGNLALFTYQLITTTPAAPTGLQLDPTLPAPGGSDSGLSKTDKITNVTSPFIDVTPSGPNAAAGEIQLLRDGVVVNTFLIPAGPVSGPVVINDPGPVMPDGTHVYTAIQEDVAGNMSPVSASLTITLDTVAPPTPAAPVLAPADDSGVKGDGITNVREPHLVGMLVPETVDPIAQVQIVGANGAVLGTAFSALSGAYSVQFASPLADGTYSVRVRAEDIAGNTSATSAAFVLQIITKLPTAPTIAVLPSDVSGPPGSNITNINQPHLFGTTDPGVFVDLIDTNGDVSGIPGSVLATVTADSSGNYLIQFPAPLPDGVYHIQTQARDVAANTSLSPILTLTILTKAPTTAPTIMLLPADDTGIKGDGITTVRRPHLIGVGSPNGVVQVIDSTGTVLGSATADGSGNYSLQLPHNLNNGTILLRARATDIAGNQGPTSAPFNLTITTNIGDYTDTGKADLAVFRGSTGQAFIMPGAPAIPYAVSTVGQNGDIPLQGDFDGDGKTDVAFYRPSTATWYIYRSQLGFEQIQFGEANVDIPVPGDYDHDGRTDLAVYRPTNNTWYVLGSAGTPIVRSFGQAGDIPAPGAYDGNLTTEIAVYRPSTAQFVISEPGNTSRTVSVGTIGAKNVPIPADFDGIGKDEPAVYQPATGTWLIANPITGIRKVPSFGVPNTDIPVPRDYDGDGKADLAVFRPSNATWYILFSGGGYWVQQFGASTDIPIAEPLSYLTASIGSQSHAQSFGGGSPGFRTAAFDFGQQAANLAGSSTPATVPVPIPGPTSGSNSAVNLTPAPPPIPLSSGTSHRRRINVAHRASEHAAALHKHAAANHNDGALAAVLGSLGRIKLGRFLPTHEA